MYQNYAVGWKSKLRQLSWLWKYVTVKLGDKELFGHPKNVPYPNKVNCKLVTGNCSLTPICSLSKRSLSPSLTVVLLLYRVVVYYPVTKKILFSAEYINYLIYSALNKIESLICKKTFSLCRIQYKSTEQTSYIHILGRILYNFSFSVLSLFKTIVCCIL